MVYAYNSLGLTEPSDKLPAISGVAQEFKKTIKSRYYAGMWEDCLLSQLLWEVVYPVKRSDSYRAPTWSWASVDGEIHADILNELTFMALPGQEATQEPLNTTILVEVIDVQIVLENEEIETGRVKDGLLRMRGRLTPVSLSVNPDEDHNPGILNFAMESSKGNTDEYWGLIYVDVLPTTPLEGHFFCVPFARKGLDSCECMLLRATGRARGQFERLGILHGRTRSVQHFCEEQSKEDCIGEEFYLEKTSGEFHTYEFDIV